MAHHPIPEPDPGPRQPRSFPATQPAQPPGTSEPVLNFRSDFEELIATFSSDAGGNLSAELSSDLALEVVLNGIVEQACLASDATGAAVILERNGEWVCRARNGQTAPELGERLSSASGLTAKCIRTREIQRSEDVESDLITDGEACRALGVRSMMALPLITGTTLVGVLAAFSSRVGAFGESQEQALQAFAEHVLNGLDLVSKAGTPPTKRAGLAPSISNSVSKPEAVSQSGAIAEKFHDQVSPPVPTGQDATQERARVNKSQQVLEMQSPESNQEKQAFSGPISFPGRQITAITWVLAAAVLAFAILLTMITGQRLLGKTQANRRAKPNASVPQQAGSRANSTEKGQGMTADSAIADRVAIESRDTSDSAISANESANVSATQSAIPPGPLPPAGGLSVYDDGKEVFRMVPGRDGAMVPYTGSGRDAAITRASASGSAGAVESPPQAGEGDVVFRVTPAYPEKAREQGIQGQVVLDVTAARDGSVRNLSLRSGEPVLAEAAMVAVKQWKFKPRVIQGEPVEMQTRVTLNFRLPR